MIQPISKSHVGIDPLITPWSRRISPPARSGTNKAERLAAYVRRFQNTDPHTLVDIACSKNPLIEPNEHITALMILFKHEVDKNITLTELEKGRLLDLLIDKHKKNPIDTTNLQDKRDHAFLKAEAAVVLAKANVKSPEFVQALTEILNTMDKDPFFQKDNNWNLYYKPVLSALYLTNKTAVEPFITKHKVNPITIDRLEKVTLIS